MSVFFTILSGVSVFVLGQLIQRNVFEPILEYKKARATLLRHLLNYAGVITTTLPSDGSADANFLAYKNKAIEVGSDLIAAARAIPAYSFYRKYLKYPSEEGTLIVASDLIDIANNMNSNTSVEHYFKGERAEALNRIMRILNFHMKDTDFELIATGAYKNGKSLPHVLKGVKEALPEDIRQ